jgi:hypothetical protein
MILLVTYDLKGPAGSYESLFKAIQRNGMWWHYLTNTWLVRGESPKAVSESMHQHIKPGDLFLVAELGPYWGVLPKDAWDWIELHGEGKYKPFGT